jgi:PAS domain S-box-containing protein
MPLENEELSGDSGIGAQTARQPADPPPSTPALPHPINVDLPAPADRLQQGLFDQAPFSVQTFHPDGRVKSVNRGWERLFGFTLADYPDYNILQDRQLEEHGIMPLIRRGFAGESLQIPTIPYVPDRGQYKGQRRWCGACIYPLRNVDGVIEEVVLVHIDMTEQSEARDKLILYREIFANSSDGIGIIDPQGRYLEQNQSHARLTGFSDAEIRGQSPAIHLGLPAFEMIATALQVQGHFRGELVSHTKTQGDVPVELSAFAVKDVLGQPLCYVGVKRDIRERKRAEDEREYLLNAERAARAEAERANGVKDDFLATLSHELRTPLNAILGWCQLLRAGGITRPEDLEEALDTIERNTRAQAEIISDLLDMSRIREGKLRLEVREVDLAEVVRAAVNTVKASADAKGVGIETRLQVGHCPDGALTTTGDFGRLQQVVWNLLSNGIKFTPPAGNLRVTLSCPDHQAQVIVSDDGPGINPEFIPYVFERFRQADSSAARKHGGLGLGLAIVKSLVNMHGGTIDVESPGELGGATFQVRLPLNAMATQPVSGETEPRAKPKSWGAGTSPLTRLRVLAIDDEPDARKLIKRVLEMAGAQVTSVGSVAEALEAFDSMQPDLVLSDISMPGVDGYELIRCIRATGPPRGNVPAVALTAFARPEDRQRALACGFDEHVTKPVEPMNLIGVLARVVSRRKRTG